MAMARTRDVEFPFTLERSNTDGDGLTFEGYAAVFNSPTDIRDQDGEYVETIAPGAFKKTIESRTPVFMFDHGKHPVWGPLPIGKIVELREDPRGLFVKARMFASDFFAPIREAIDAQAINGMSFRFEIVRDAWTGPSRGKRSRQIREAKVPELGPVIFPAYADTTAALRSICAGFEQTFPGAIRVEILEARDNDVEITTSDQSVADMVSDAIETLWGLSDNSSDAYIVNFYDGHADFVVYGNGMRDYPGFWRVDYTSNDGAVTIGDPYRPPLADPVTGLNSEPLDGEARDESEPMTEDLSTSEDAAPEVGTSEDAAAEEVRTGPFSLDERRRIARQIRARAS